MISIDNTPLNDHPRDADFTVDSYRELLIVAKQKYLFSTYDDIPWGQRFLLWRHDCDFSLNRAIALAKIESEEGVQTTYFLNPHCEYYNVFELSQHRLVLEILELGHKIGLHFDAAFHSTANEENLDALVLNESILLEGLFGVRPSVFSFHNPIASHLKCEKEKYGGLVNCYSERFKTEVPYCSDSNGYWRFRRLQDVLLQATDPCLQVLTHPGWWQEAPMPPRKRIFRSIAGRAKASMDLYDGWLELNGRQNMNGAGGSLRFLSDYDKEAFDLCDLLWNREDYPALFFELWRLKKRQTYNICSAVFLSQWNIPSGKIEEFFQNLHPEIPNSHIMACVFGNEWEEFSPISETKTNHLWSQFVNGHGTSDKVLLEEGCIYLCHSIEAVAKWGNSQPFSFNGLDHPSIFGGKSERRPELPSRRVENVEKGATKDDLDRWVKFRNDVERN